MVIFHSYVSLPEGITHDLRSIFWVKSRDTETSVHTGWTASKVGVSRSNFGKIPVRILKGSKNFVNPHWFQQWSSTTNNSGEKRKIYGNALPYWIAFKKWSRQNKSKSLRITPCERQDWGSGQLRRPSHWLKLISNADVHVFAASANRGTVFKYLWWGQHSHSSLNIFLNSFNNLQMVWWTMINSSYILGMAGWPIQPF
jgi:hypothetical protein